MNRKERILKYINSSDDFVVNGKRYCENDFYNDVEDLVKENKKYKEVIDKAIKYIESNNETLYTYEPDYDYEENMVDNYDISNYREDLLKILKEVE